MNKPQYFTQQLIKYYTIGGRPFKTSMIFGYILTIFSLMLIKAYFLLHSKLYHKTKRSFFCFSNLSIALRNHNFCSFTCHFVLSIHFLENPKQFLIDSDTLPIMTYLSICHLSFWRYRIMSIGRKYF